MGFADHVASHCPLCRSKVSNAARVELENPHTFNDVIDCPRCGKMILSSATQSVLALADPEVIAEVAKALQLRRDRGDNAPAYLRPEQFV